ncbi:MAG: hypothetical protein ABR553_04405 [Gammaproteobacteria bacterium]
MLWKLVEICLLRTGPQDLPAAPRFLALMVTGYLLVNVLISRLSFGLGAALAVSALDALLLAAFTQLLLRLAAKPERFNQTLAALAGTGMLLGLIAFPLIQGLTAAQTAGEANAGLALAWLAVLVWSLLILGHILRHALSIPLMTGVGLGVLYSLLSVMIVRGVFPGG